MRARRRDTLGASRPLRRLATGGLCALASLGSTTRSAKAGEGALPRLSVVAPEGVAECPDAASIASKLRELAGHDVVTIDSSGPADERWLVTLRREGSGYGATVRVEGARSGERQLNAPGVACGELREAVAVTIALVLDHALVLDAPKTAAPARPEAPPSRVSLEGRLGAEVGLLPNASTLGALGLEVSPSPGHWAFGGGAFGVAPVTVEDDPGRVDLSLLGAYARACRLVAGAPEALRGSVCALAAFGALGGKGRGYPSGNRQAYSPWVAPGVAASLRGPLGGAFGWSLTAAGYAPLLRGGFSIGNRGVVYDPAPAGASLEAGVFWTIR